MLDPYINSMHVALLRQRKPSEEAREWFAHLRERLLREGPAEFSSKEKMALLLDAESMIWLHRELWSAPSNALAEVVALGDAPVQRIDGDPDDRPLPLG